MSIDEPKFIQYMETIFKKHGSKFGVIKNKFYNSYNSSPKERDAISVYGHFYYFICAPNQKGVREELQIVGMTSLIEAMMANVEYKDPFAYFESKYKGQKSIKDIVVFKKEYFEIYGANKRIKEYFKDYVTTNDSAEILNNIERYNMDNKGAYSKSPLQNLDELAKFLYQMRSDFVHAAEMRYLCSPNCFSAIIPVGNHTYNIKIGIPEILELFEKSFVTFWQKKYDNFIKEEI